jgi:hypothetical protein
MEHLLAPKLISSGSQEINAEEEESESNKEKKEEQWEGRGSYEVYKRLGHFKRIKIKQNRQLRWRYWRR